MEDDAKVATLIIQTLDEDEAERYKAIVQLAKHTSQAEVRGSVIQHLEDSSIAVRLAAISSLASCAGSVDVHAALSRVAANDPVALVRQTALTALGHN